MPSPLWRLLNPVTGRHFQGSLLGVGRGGFEDGLIVHRRTTPGPLTDGDIHGSLGVGCVVSAQKVKCLEHCNSICFIIGVVSGVDGETESDRGRHTLSVREYTEYSNEDILK